MKNIGAHILREAKRISKDFTLILTLLIAPLFYAFFYGSIYINKVEQSVKIIVVDKDNSELSKTLTKMFDESSYVEVVGVTPNFEQAKNAFMAYQVQGIIQFSKDFEADIKRMKGADLLMFLNTSKFLPSNDIKEAISTIVMTASAGVRLEYYKATMNDKDRALVMAQPILLQDHSIFTNFTNYTDFLLPGLLLIILQQTFLMGLSESIAREVEKNTFTEWFSVSKNKILPNVFGKGLFFYLLFLAYTLFFIVVNYSVLGLNFDGDFFSLLFLFLIFFTTLLMFGSFLASFFTKEIYALQFFAFTTYPFFLMAGYAWPLEAMNPVLKLISFLIPTTHMLEAYIKIVYNGLGFTDCLEDILYLVVLLFFYGSLVHFRYAYLVKKQDVATIDKQ